MPPYRAGTGVVVDCQGQQSGQCDIIIWDDSIFRPLYSARGAGIYFIESVVAVIEVKSKLTRESVRQAIRRTEDFKRMVIYRPPPLSDGNHFWGAEPAILPLNLLFGFRSDLAGSEGDRVESVATELQIAIHDYLQVICVPGKPSWTFGEEQALCHRVQSHLPYHEVLMVFAGLLNSLKILSAKRGRPNMGFHLVPYKVDES
ncbi:MAG: hypothetical protein JWP89_4711 [Schlesneria sp.]|nr:hypothetical protein [Schlesneria sp.]